MKKSHWFIWMSLGPICLFITCLASFLYSLMSLFIDTGKLSAVAAIVVFILSFIGLGLYFIRYISIENAVTNKRVILKKGFIKTNTDELRNERIENIQIKQSILGRIFCYGDLEFKGTGGSSVIFKIIGDPISIKKEIENVVFEH